MNSFDCENILLRDRSAGRAILKRHTVLIRLSSSRTAPSVDASVVILCRSVVYGFEIVCISSGPFVQPGASLGCSSSRGVELDVAAEGRTGGTGVLEPSPYGFSLGVGAVAVP